MGGCGKSCHSSHLPIYTSRLPMNPEILLPFPHKASQLQYPCALPPSLKTPLQPFKLPPKRHSLGPHSRAVTPQPPCAHFVLRCTRESLRPKQSNIFTKCNTHTQKKMVRRQTRKNMGSPSLSPTFMPIWTHMSYQPQSEHVYAASSTNI